jgi:hypothetical protein
MKNKVPASLIKQRDYLMRRLFFLIGVDMTYTEFKKSIAQEMDHNAERRR